MDILRTPDERFEDLPGYPFRPNYLEIPGSDVSNPGLTLRVHYVDEGPIDAPVVLLLHGEPSWSYLYRKMIPPLVEAGYRTVAPDLVGFGRSDKPAQPTDYTYQRMVAWTAATIRALALEEITLFCQDWGGLIGLRLIAENGHLFSRLIAANTGLPVGGEMPEAFFQWQRFSQKVSKLPIGRIINGATITPLSREVLAAYEAPFPDETYKAGARVMPALVPTDPDDPEARINRDLWRRKLAKWPRPVLTAFSDSDPITGGGEQLFQRLMPGAKGQPHVTVEAAGHFLQEDKGEELAQVVIDFIQAAE
ncbi:MAG: haloalkane dehalogenase [Chloroflexota bacterium]|jgi:haloalkane dehalogenase